MERYFIANIDAHVGRYPICDNRHGARREPIAHCYDGDTAERITRLLNEDEARKELPDMYTRWKKLSKAPA